MSARQPLPGSVVSPLLPQLRPTAHQAWTAQVVADHVERQATQLDNENRSVMAYLLRGVMRNGCSREANALSWRIALAAVRWPTCMEGDEPKFTLADAMYEALDWDSMSEQEADAWWAEVDHG